MQIPSKDYTPARRLVPVFSPDQVEDSFNMTLQTAKAAASLGQSVLMIDCTDGGLMKHAGIVYARTLGDVLYRGANIRDAKYITSNEHFTACAAGDADLEALLGSIAALSLSYDWVFIQAPQGCTPAHVKLAAAADTALMLFHTHSDAFMRAYWMIDAIRARQHKFNPLLIAAGDENEMDETFELLSETIREFLGAPPSLGGHIDSADLASNLTQTMIKTLKARKAA